MLIQLIYASTASPLFNDEDLLQILESSRLNNERKDVTGMLLYKSRNFLQVLEGKAETVEALYQIIEQDKRHQNLLRIAQREVSQRHFGNWSMAFQNLHHPDLKSLAGYSEFLNEPFSPSIFAVRPGFATSFLDAFREGMR